MCAEYATDFISSFILNLIVASRTFVARRYALLVRSGLHTGREFNAVLNGYYRCLPTHSPCSNSNLGLRVDGRRPEELRKITSTTAVLSQADGSAYLEHGNTKVLAAVYGPREARHRALVLHDRAILNVEFNVAPFSTGERRRRTKNDK